MTLCKAGGGKEGRETKWRQNEMENRKEEGRNEEMEGKLRLFLAGKEEEKGKKRRRGKER